MTAFIGRRILFIAPRFFGYERDIVNELRRRGAAVDILPDRPFDTPFMKAVTRFSRKWVIPAADRFYRRELERLGRSSYDLIFVVNGQTLSGKTLGLLRSSFQRAKFILYVWDSFDNRRSIVDNLRYFDDCYSFDRAGAENYGLKFRPLFFSPGFEQQAGEDYDYDLSFIGTAHTDRYEIISRVAGLLKPHHRFYRYLYLQAPWVYYAFWITNASFHQAKIGDFHFNPLASSEVQRVFFASRAILDIEHPKQTGLTIRTLETLGASRKLITTNIRVREYDFFTPGNICVIDRRSPIIPSAFLETAYQPIDPKLYRKYSLAGWLDEILSGWTNK
ncbi:MAG TPA: hypothetical protein VG759_16860 [Candidatus Angelobacter sp.]|jgi:hypothetical protein|nr:hypothetical protein [Candidatus Angelobacter sp.]